ATHPIHVALMVQANGGSEDAVIAALLHDLLEDTGVTREDLEEGFGARITGIVEEVSEDKSLRWEERKRRMVERIRTASPEACLVAAADKTHNLATLVDAYERVGADVWKAFRRGPGPTVRHFTEMFEALRGRIPAGLEAAFAQALDRARMIQPARGSQIPPDPEDAGPASEAS
ncbi:MAG: HD domain-containing protein, partial [Candidatus Eisenbacteria bacterium]|nr:HD domain-containing protein [Candidatus Eisenbacteria bacterium]